MHRGNEQDWNDLKYFLNNIIFLMLNSSHNFRSTENQESDRNCNLQLHHETGVRWCTNRWSNSWGSASVFTLQWDPWCCPNGSKVWLILCEKYELTICPTHFITLTFKNNYLFQTNLGFCWDWEDPCCSNQSWLLGPWIPAIWVCNWDSSDPHSSNEDQWCSSPGNTLTISESNPLNHTEHINWN